MASGWNTRPKPTANREERKSVMSGGRRRAIITPVSSGTSSSHGVTLKRSASAVRKASTSWLSAGSTHSPLMVKMASATSSEGVVVMSM